MKYEDENKEYSDDYEDEEDYYDTEEKYTDGDITDIGKPYLKLVGTDGNVFSILGKALRAARKAKWPQIKIDEYKKKATSGNYNNALATTMEYFDVY